MQTPQRHPKTLRFRQQKRLMARRPRSQAWRQYKKYQTVRKHEYGTRIAIVLHSTCLANLEDMTGSKGDPMARCTSLKGLQTLALPLQLDFGANSTRLPCTPDFQLISTWSISLAWSLGQFFMEPLVPPPCLQLGVAPSEGTHATGQVRPSEQILTFYQDRKTCVT